MSDPNTPSGDLTPDHSSSEEVGLSGKEKPSRELGEADRRVNKDSSGRKRRRSKSTEGRLEPQKEADRGGHEIVDDGAASFQAGHSSVDGNGRSRHSQRELGSARDGQSDHSSRRSSRHKNRSRRSSSLAKSDSATDALSHRGSVGGSDVGSGNVDRRADRGRMNSSSRRTRRDSGNRSQDSGGSSVSRGRRRSYSRPPSESGSTYTRTSSDASGSTVSSEYDSPQRLPPARRRSRSRSGSSNSDRTSSSDTNSNASDTNSNASDANSSYTSHSEGRGDHASEGEDGNEDAFTTLTEGSIAAYRQDPAITGHISDSAIRRHALYLGMNPVLDKNLMWIAEESLRAPIPLGWMVRKDRYGIIYCNEHTGSIQRNHPLDTQYYEIYMKEKSAHARVDNDTLSLESGDAEKRAGGYLAKMEEEEEEEYARRRGHGVEDVSDEEVDPTTIGPVTPTQFQEMCVILGIKLPEEVDLTWIALGVLNEPLTKNWHVHCTPDGDHYYFNRVTRKSTPHKPVPPIYLKVLEHVRLERLKSQALKEATSHSGPPKPEETNDLKDPELARRHSQALEKVSAWQEKQRDDAVWVQLLAHDETPYFYNPITHQRQVQMPADPDNSTVLVVNTVYARENMEKHVGPLKTKAATKIQKAWRENIPQIRKTSKSRLGARSSRNLVRRRSSAGNQGSTFEEEVIVTEEVLSRSDKGSKSSQRKDSKAEGDEVEIEEIVEEYAAEGYVSEEAMNQRVQEAVREAEAKWRKETVEEYEEIIEECHVLRDERDTLSAKLVDMEMSFQKQTEELRKENKELTELVAELEDELEVWKRRFHGGGGESWDEERAELHALLDARNADVERMQRKLDNEREDYEEVIRVLKEQLNQSLRANKDTERVVVTRKSISSESQSHRSAPRPSFSSMESLSASNPSVSTTTAPVAATVMTTTTHSNSSGSADATAPSLPASYAAGTSDAGLASLPSSLMDLSPAFIPPSLSTSTATATSSTTTSTTTASSSLPPSSNIFALSDLLGTAAYTSRSSLLNPVPHLGNSDILSTGTGGGSSAGATTSSSGATASSLNADLWGL